MCAQEALIEIGKLARAPGEEDNTKHLTPQQLKRLSFNEKLMYKISSAARARDYKTMNRRILMLLSLNPFTFVIGSTVVAAFTITFFICMCCRPEPLELDGVHTAPAPILEPNREPSSNDKASVNAVQTLKSEPKKER